MRTLLRFTVFIVFCFYSVVGNGQVIYTIAGSEQQITFQQNAQTIDLSYFAKGVYVLKLTNGQTMKIIKE